MDQQGRYTFRNLEIWKMTQAFAVQVSKICDDLPNKRSADIAARQLIRSSTSIAANIAEGHGRFSYAAYRHHLSIAKGSVTESEGWIDYLVQMEHISSELGRKLAQQAIRITAALSRRITQLDRQLGPSQLRDERAVYDAGPAQDEGFAASILRMDLLEDER